LYFTHILAVTLNVTILKDSLLKGFEKPLNTYKYRLFPHVFNIRLIMMALKQKKAPFQDRKEANLNIP